MRTSVICLFLSLVVGTVGCAKKVPPTLEGVSSLNSFQKEQPEQKPGKGLDTPPPQNELPARFKLLNLLLKNNAQINLRVRSSSSPADHFGAYDLDHTDATGETCRVSTSEFSVTYCCAEMQRAFTEQKDTFLIETPDGCYKRHFESLIETATLESLRNALLGSEDLDSYHFEHAPGKMVLNPLKSDTMEPDSSIAFEYQAEPPLDSRYSDPTGGTGAKRNNIQGTWKMSGVSPKK